MLAGLAATGCNTVNGDDDGPTAPTPIGPGTGPVHYTAIAQSDGIGVGSSQPCVPLADCPNGTGYVQIIARRLRETLGNSLGRRPTGNLLARAAPFVPTTTRLLTVFVGGNDANTIAAGAATQGDRDAFISAQVQGFSRDLTALLDTARNRAPSAQVIVVNLPNLAGLPYARAFSSGDRELLQQASVRLTREAINPLAGRVTVVDLMCDGRSYDPANYSSDGFHPSDSGYLLIADLVWAAIQNGNGHPPPPASCAQMNVA